MGNLLTSHLGWADGQRDTGWRRENRLRAAQDLLPPGRNLIPAADLEPRRRRVGVEKDG